MILVLASRGGLPLPWRNPTFEWEVLFDPAFLVPGGLAALAVLVGWWLARSRHLATYAAVVVPSFMWASVEQRIPGPASWNVPLPGMMMHGFSEAFAVLARLWFLLAASVITITAVRAADLSVRRWGIAAGAVVLPAAVSTLVRTVLQQLEGAPVPFLVGITWLILSVMIGPLAWRWWQCKFRDQTPHGAVGGSGRTKWVETWGLYALGTPALLSGLLFAVVLIPQLAWSAGDDPSSLLFLLVIFVNGLWLAAAGACCVREAWRWGMETRPSTKHGDPDAGPPVAG